MAKNPLAPQCGGFDVKSDVPQIVDDVKAPDRTTPPVEQHEMFYMEGAGGHPHEAQTVA